MGWEFPIVNQDESGIAQQPKEGVYMNGLVIEGARWDSDNGYLEESRPMDLLTPMPIVHFKPTEAKKKSRGFYQASCYMYPIRTGTRERHPFIVAVDLKC